jgi:fibro-slime domain-containing protein
VTTVKCGDGKVSPGLETCDDGNTTAGDGCSVTCMLEPGWDCEVAGERCAAHCGDGMIVGDEECEFYNGAAPAAGNGCGVDCRIEPGWDCNGTTTVCARTVCGNHTVERGEGCDDGNLAPFDGCFNCAAEPPCNGVTCQAVCGDGKRYNTEACDDGNIRDGDGCSHDCKVEMGYMCTDIMPAASADRISLPVIYRDFIGDIKPAETALTRASPALATARAAAGVLLHPDFNHFIGNGTRGVVKPLLAADGLPDYVTVANPGEPANFTGKTNFDRWYRDDPAYNRSIISTIDLARTGTLYLFDSVNTAGFFPLDNRGFIPTLDAAAVCCNHNFSFTTETRFWFEYGGGETFDFSGDDDVWVFVNNRLILDLGGLHPRITGSFTLDATSGVAHVTSALLTGTVDIDAQLVIGSVYQVAMFHAEREEVQSNFKLTLKDFNKPKSQCGPVCGDGFVSHTEVCDDGKNDGSYGGCMPGCKKRGPYCGDAHVDPGHETCDDGVNLSEYGGCGPGCVAGPSCGDGIVQSKFEQCDDGVNAGLYGGCAAQCVLGPHCGDGVVQADKGEECDPPSVMASCNASCKIARVN